MKNVPANCLVCEHTSSCGSYYGGLGCQFDIDIKNKKTAIQRFWDWVTNNKK